MKKVVVLTICILLSVTACTTKKGESPSTNNLVETKEISVVTEKDSDKVVTDTAVVEYVEEVTNEVETLSQAENLSEKTKNSLKKTFITITDFIFYDGTIKGKTFKELSSTAQIKILELYEKLDDKIETIFPNYKEDIKDTSIKTYSKIREKTKELKETIKNVYIERVGEDTYQKEVDIITNVKDKLVEKSTPVIAEAKDKAKDTYNKTKDKLDEWYKNFKESSE